MTHDPSLPPTDESASAPKSLAPGVLTEPVPLRDALEGIGALWRLPRKRTRAGGTPSGGADNERTTRPADTQATPDAAPAPTNRDTSTNALPATAARAADRTGIPARVLAAGVAIASGLSWWSFQPAALQRDEMPAPLRTTWRTSNPAYARSAMVITDSTITFMTVDASAADPTRPVEMRHRITGLRTEARGDTVDFTLTYDSEGNPVELQARVVGGGAPSLTFVRPEGLTWYPADAAATAGR